MSLEKVFKSLMPMTETAYYILLSLTKLRPDYGIIQHVEKITEGRIRTGSGTVYSTLTKMQKGGVITVYSDEDIKTIYEITEIGRELIKSDINRIKELHNNAVRYISDYQNVEDEC